MAGLCELIAASDVQPRILGLTASPLNSKKGSLESVLGRLLSLTQTELVVPIEDMEDLLSYAAIPDMFIARYTAPAQTYWDKTILIASMDRSMAQSAPQMLALTYLRARHAYYIFSFYLLVRSRHLSLKDITGIESLKLQESIPLTNGRTLDEIQQFLLQILRVAEECGVFCAISALSFYCQAGRQSSGYDEDASGMYIPSKTSVNPDRIEEQVLEILRGPFADEIGNLCDFHSVATSSLFTCFSLLFLCLPYVVRKRSLEALKERPIMIDDYLYQFLLKLMNFDADSITSLTSTVFLFLTEHVRCTHGSQQKMQFFQCVKQSIGELCAITLESLTSDDVLSNCEEELQLEPWVVDGYEFDLRGNFVLEEVVQQSKEFLAITPKLSAVIRLLVDKSVAMKEDEEHVQNSWACIMFTQMRLSCISMCRIIKIALQDSMIATARGVKADYITGVTKLKHQYQKLIDFKAGKVNFLLASSVAEEGIDVKVSY